MFGKKLVKSGTSGVPKLEVELQRRASPGWKLGTQERDLEKRAGVWRAGQAQETCVGSVGKLPSTPTRAFSALLNR